jgi:hypothetical protein
MRNAKPSSIVKQTIIKQETEMGYKIKISDVGIVEDEIETEEQAKEKFENFIEMSRELDSGGYYGKNVQLLKDDVVIDEYVPFCPHSYVDGPNDYFNGYGESE